MAINSRNRLGKNRKEPEINISPLIDIVFILLIFFLVTTTFVKDRALDIRKPGSASADAKQEKYLRIAIDRYNQIWIDGRPVRDDEIPFFLKQAREKMDKQVLIVADRESTNATLVKVIDHCNQAGLEKVSLATEKQ